MKGTLEGEYLPNPTFHSVFGEKADDKSNGAEMTDYYRYIDTRLADIEAKLDIRMAAIQRYQEQADARVERQIKEAESRMEKAVSDVKTDSKTTRVTVVTTAIGSVIAMGGLVAAIVFSFQATISEQGAWLRQSVERIEQRAQPAPTPQIDLPAIQAPAHTE